MNETKLVVFLLNNQLFGVDSSQVFQIIPYTEAVKVPKMPEFIEGITDFRGNVLPLINLCKRFGFGDGKVSDSAKILAVKINDKFSGYIVDDVKEIINVSEKDMEPVPEIMFGAVNTYLKKVAKKGDTLISVLDLEKILNENEINSLPA